MNQEEIVEYLSTLPNADELSEKAQDILEFVLGTSTNPDTIELVKLAYCLGYALGIVED